MITIKEQNFNSFFEAPFAAYGPNSLYVSPMKGDLKRFLSLKNPLFSSLDDFTYFTALQNGQPVGRITAHIHRASNTQFKAAKCYFGFFDCIDDAQAAEALLTAAEDWALARGMPEISGNFNLTAMQQAGIMTEGFEKAPYTDQIWGPPHLPALLKANGYSQHFPMTTFSRSFEVGPKPQLLPDEMRADLLAEGFSFAPFTRATVADRLEDARTILNRSFRDNPMFVPVTRAEFMFQAKDMMWIMDRRISKVVHFEGKPAGAVVAIPDLNPLLKQLGSKLRLSLPWHYIRHLKTRDRAVVIFQGVMPEYQRRSVNPLMLSEMTKDMLSAGYKTVGGTWIADENSASLRQTEKSGAEPLHRLHLFSKSLN